MEWRKPSPALAALLDDALAVLPRQKRIMFGMPAYFVNGNMFAGLHQDNVILRLAPDDRQSLLSKWSEATQFEPMPGRPMREYVVVPAGLYRDSALFGEWLTRSFDYAAALPPKEPKRRKK